MKKKVIAVLLSLSLAAGSVPGYAMAEEPGGPGEEIVVIDEGEAVPAAEDVVESPAADDAVIVEDGVEIAGIEELEIPAEDAVSEDEPVVTDEVAVDAAEVSEDPEIELVEDGEAEEAEVVDPSPEPEKDKNDTNAYVGNGSGSIESSLTVEFRDREKTISSGTGFSTVVNNNVKATIPSGLANGQEYYVATVASLPHFVYDPTYKENYNDQDPTEVMKILPELKITWTAYDGTDENGIYTSTNQTPASPILLQAGKDYKYDLVGTDLATKGGNTASATIQVTFRGHYANITKLRIPCIVDSKSLKATSQEIHKVEIKTDQVRDKSDNTYHFVYDGTPHYPTIIKDESGKEVGVTYKDVPLKRWYPAQHKNKDGTLQENPDMPTNDPEAETDDWYTVTLKDKDGNPVSEDGVGVNGSIRASQSKKNSTYTEYYTMTVQGYKNYANTYEYNYVIEQREAIKGDVEGLDNYTFYIELDEHEVAERIKESLVNKLENKPDGNSLDDTEGSMGPDGGYEIYYYKMNGKNEEIPFTSENFPNIPGANAKGTGAPGFDDNGDGIFNKNPGDNEVRVKPSDRAAVEALCGEYTYHIKFTGNGNFKENNANDSVICGKFTISEDEPHLANVYKSLEDKILDELEKLNPTYDANDWFKREGGDSDTIKNANDVEEVVKAVFNTYTYTKKDSKGNIVKNCKAGDNIEVSLHPQHNGKMIDAGYYVIRITGINDWKDDLKGDGYIDMDEPGKMAYVDRRSLDIDDDTIPTNTQIDYTGAKGASKKGDTIDKFYIGPSPLVQGQPPVASSLNPDAAEEYNYKIHPNTDEYRDGQIYKYGAIQYLKAYNDTTKGYTDPEVTITHLVKDTKDTESYPLAEYQNEAPVEIETRTATDRSGYNDSTYTSGNGYVSRQAREKELEQGETKDFVIVESPSTTNGGVTIIEGRGNYKGRIKVPTVQKNLINLSDESAVEVKVKVNKFDKYNKAENAVEVSENGLDLHYNEATGIIVKPENVQVTIGGKTVSPLDYVVVIDERDVNSLCQNCQKIDNVGIGRHVTVGWHQVIVKASNKTTCTGFQEAKFYISSDLTFDKDYKAVWDTKKLADAGYADAASLQEKELIAGQKVDKDKAPHNFVKVVSVNSDYVELRYDKEYDYECYIPQEIWDAAYHKEDGTVDEELLKTRYYMNVEDRVEFGKAGWWYLVLKPVNTTGTKVGQYEGYVTLPFEVQPKPFENVEAGGKIRVVVKDEYKDDEYENGVITWPGHNITGAELAKMFRVEDTGKSVVTELEFGVDYTIEETIKDVGLHAVTLKGINNYKGTFDTKEIMVKPASLKGAKIELGDALAYRGEAFSGTLDEISKGRMKVTSVLGYEVPAADYSVTVESADKAVGTVVKVTVNGQNHYTDSETKADGTIQEADLSNEVFFTLKVDENSQNVVYKGEPVELPASSLKLMDNRTNKEIAIKAGSVKYSNNEKPGTAAVTAEADDSNYKNTATATFTITQNLGKVVLKNNGVFTYKKAPYAPADVIDAVYDAKGTVITSDNYSAVIKAGDDAENAGKATVVVTIQVDGKDVALEKTFTIEPLKITDVTNLKSEYVYDGTVIRPAVTVVAGEVILQNKDYVIYNTENANVGAKEIVVQAIGNYTGNIAKQFTVVPASVEGASITGVKASYKYNGTARQPKVKVTVNGRVLKRDVDYKVTYSADSTAVGGKTATIEGTGNYTGSQVKAYSVVPAKAVVSSVKAGKKKLTVNVAAQAGVTYQIQYKVSGNDTWSSAKATGTKKVLKGLKSGKKYDIRVRAYATIDGARVNGAWSKVTVSKKVKK